MLISVLTVTSVWKRGYLGDV